MDCTTRIAELMLDAVDHHQALRFAQAIDRYSEVVQLQPSYGDAWRLLGVVALQTADYEAAGSLLERALRVNPADGAAYSALGSVREAQGNLVAAYTAFQTACALDETQEIASTGLTRMALALGHIVEALAVAEGALARGMRGASLRRALGAARLALRDYHGARDALIGSLKIAPHPDALANLGAAYVHLHEVQAAISACQDALALDPRHAEAMNNLGIARKAEGNFALALTAFESAVQLGSEDAHVNLGTTRLLLGDYLNGWPHYGWVRAERRANPAFTTLTMWDGGPAPGRRLLIWPEQGVGDTIQMVRFVRRARELVGSVTLACPVQTIELLSCIDGVDDVVCAGGIRSLDGFDLWLPTIRLPVIFKVEEKLIPASPYLRASPAHCAKFQARFEPSDRLCVGLVWSGNPQFAWNDYRSCGLAQLEPLRDITDITWFALQQGAARAEQAQSSLALVPINDEVADFSDTAAIIAQLDLVITVDTSVAHLAGALGQRAWVLLSNRPDWRWGLGGETSAWYPTLRLFRQSDEGSWAPVVTAICTALREFRASKTSVITSH